MVQLEPPVVHAPKAQLRADVPALDSGQRLVRLHVPQLHHKGVRPAVDAAAAEEARHDHRVRRRRSQAPGPPLRRRQRGRVQHELVPAGVERRGGLEPSHEGPVAELRLRVGSDNSKRERVGQELGLLLRVRLRQEGRDEHLLCFIFIGGEKWG